MSSASIGSTDKKVTPLRRARLCPSAELCQALREALRENANAEKAPGMQAYMKSEMPYLGVQTPVLKAVCRKVFAAHPIEAQKRWLDTILVIWRNADYREERYAAIRLGEHHAYEEFRTLTALPCYEEMIVDGAWWDYVDAIAPRLVGGLLRRYPEETKGVMLEWAHSSDIWKRRTSIICQLKFKDATDVDLLQCLYRAVHRSYRVLPTQSDCLGAARIRQDRSGRAVIAYITENAHRMSTFSKKEALRLLIRSGRKLTPCLKRNS